MRTFVALEVPDGFRFEVAALARQLAEHVDGRFTQPENYHLTLAFLGDTSEREIALAIDALETACANRLALPLAADGLGKFGKANDATLWLGIAPVDALVAMADEVRNALAAHELPFDQKPFKPHITLARRAAIPKTVLPSLPFPAPAHASAVTLFKSELDSEGAIYTPLHAIELAQP
ncbi:MAG: RNA 2',3'-cyclic phosphodiesterase [Eggerthellaceae bacterium]|nr:RNA 2',3'-cyclic phosphodiesterase [Eggerthellaceae bacterium]